MQTMTITHQQVIDLVSTLPVERLQSVFDFTLFLKQQSLTATPEHDLFGQCPEEIEADEEEWEKQFAASQPRLRDMAFEAATDFRSGRTKPMEFTQEGRLVR